MFEYVLIGLGGQDGSPDTGRIPQIFVKSLELGIYPIPTWTQCCIPNLAPGVPYCTSAAGPCRTVLPRPAPHVTAYIRPQSFDSPRLSSTALCYREPVSVNTEQTTDRDYPDFLKTSLSPIITQSAPTACLRIASYYHFSSVVRGVAEHSIFGTAGETGSPDSRGKFCPQR